MIAINYALAQLNVQNEGDTPLSYKVTFVKQEDGTLRTINRAVKNHKKGSSTAEKGSGLKINLKESDAVLLYDLDKNEFRAVLIPNIIAFNDETVFH